MTFYGEISDLEFTKLKESFKSKRYAESIDYPDQQNVWGCDLEKLNPLLLQMIFTLHKRIEELELRLGI